MPATVLVRSMMLEDAPAYLETLRTSILCIASKDYAPLVIEGCAPSVMAHIHPCDAQFTYGA